MKNSFLKFKIGLILIDLNKIFPMKPSEFEISVPVESSYEKLFEIAEITTMLKSHSFQTQKISILNFDSTS